MDTTFMNINNSSLLLRTCDLPAYGTQDDICYSSDSRGYTNTWTNLDLSGIIGQDEYNKYDYFELQNIYQMQSANLGTVVNGAQSLAYLTAKGLPFINGYIFCNGPYQAPTPPRLSSEVVLGQLINAVAPVFPYNYNTSSNNVTLGSIYMPFEPTPVIFSKVDTFDLTLTPRRYDTGNPLTTAKNSELAYLIKIRGVKIEDMRSSFILRGILQSSTGVYTYNNFSMKQALGILWDKYDTFNIKMTQMFHIFDGVASGIKNSDRPCYLTLKGLDFIDSKNNMTSNSKQEQVLTHLSFYNAGNSYAGYKQNSNNGVIFKKNNDNVNLEITFHNIVNGGWVYDFTIPHMFYFMITPII